MSAQIQCPELCKKHQSLLIHQAKFSDKDPWRALIVVAQLALFQAATCDDKTHKIIGDDISKIKDIGCLACFKPDAIMV